MTFSVRVMTMADYESVMRLLEATPGISLRDADSREATARYLDRNPGMSFVAECDGEIIGCILSGHDGRRGYLQHLVVRAGHRRQGIASALVDGCLSTLHGLGIFKAHVDVFRTNELAQAYWQGRGWQLRADIDRYSSVGNGSANA